MTLSSEDVLRLSPVIPVVTIASAAHAAPLARALLAGGLKTVEVTLRTPAALEAIAVMAREDALVVGAGTVLNAEHLAAAARAGARFALSPGATPALLEAGRNSPIPLIPGTASASEMMQGLEYGYRCLKFYPAETLGGVEALKLMAGPLPQPLLCPTGGISAERAPDYLALDNVGCVGGSWIAPQHLIAREDWAAIEANARRAASMRG